MKKKMSPEFGIFITVFIDLLSFGMFIPDLQLRATQFGAAGFELGLMISCYSIAQFIFAPLLGRLSDRIGRRPILLITTSFGALTYIAYAHADSLIWMFIARSLAGIAAANVGVAYAYMADITTPENRAKGIGLIGAAFGMGFIFGAPLGAFLVQLGNGTAHVLGYSALIFSFINFLYILFFLPETHRVQVEQQPFGLKSQLRTLKKAFKTPELGFYLVLYFVANFAVSNLESTFMQMAVIYHHLTMIGGALLLTMSGLISAMIQGGIIRIIVPKFGELNLVRAGYFIQVPSLMMLPFSLTWPMLALNVIFFAIGRGLSDPCLNSLISRSVPSTIQGGIFGITQSVGALARMISPIIANTLFNYRHWMPYIFAGTLLLLPLFWTFKLLKQKKMSQYPKS